MLKHDNLHFDAIERLQTGIAKVAKAVGGTMGTGGGNAILEAIENPGHLTTNDGYSIANSIVLADPIEDMGRKILLEAINRANKQSGDGSSTTCVLTAAVLEEGRKQEGHHPMDIKRSLEECLPLIEANLKEQSRDVTVDNVDQVATISAEDETIGKMIGEIYKQIGPKGIIHWDVSKTTEDSYTVGKGITVDGAGIASPYMYDRDNETGEYKKIATLKDPKVLIVKEKLTTAAVFDKLFAQMDAKGDKEVAIFCEDFDVNVVAQLVMTQQMRGFRAVIVKMPVIWRDEWYSDLALASGATVIDPRAGLQLKDITTEHLGTFGHLKIDVETTYIDGIKDLTTHVDGLTATGEDGALLRASRLNTKTARYFVGAQSESALSYRRLKVEDAISAAYQALNGGIVAGGGVALANVAKKLPDTIGGTILSEALFAPFQQVLTNAGIPKEAGGLSSKAMLSMARPTVGIDTRTKEAVDMFEAGIVDPTNIVLNAVKNAVSVAAAVLTAPTLVTLPREEAPSAGQLSPSSAIMR